VSVYDELARLGSATVYEGGGRGGFVDADLVQVVPGSRPAIDSRTHDALLAENAALRAQIAAQAAPRDEVVITRRRRKTAGGG